MVGRKPNLRRGWQKAASTRRFVYTSLETYFQALLHQFNTPYRSSLKNLFLCKSIAQKHVMVLNIRVWYLLEIMYEH
jgi:hypothetical protein